MIWGRGYITDLHYLSSFFNANAPNHLRIVQLLNGQRPPDRDAKYRCLEIGAGSGVGLAVIAASDPNGEFVAVDYMPGHIAAGAQFGRAAKMTNIDFVEADIVELVNSNDHDLGEFDYIICHGVYSWVGPQVREAILALLRKSLRPGGLLFFGYNSLPGWTMTGPAQKLISEFGKSAAGAVQDRVVGAFDFVNQMARLEAKFLDPDQIPVLGRKASDGVADLGGNEIRYLAHEYFSEQWSPEYFIDVARELAAEKMDFVGSATMTDLFSPMVATEPQRQLLANVPDKLMVEQLKDYFSPQMYRRDVYVRGYAPITDRERTKRLKDERMMLIGHPEKFEYKINCRLGEAELPRAPYEAALEKLAEGPCTIGDIVSHIEKNGSSLSAEETMAILTVSSMATSAPDDTGGPTEAVRDFNRAMTEFALEDLSAHQLAVAAPQLRNGLFLSRNDFTIFKTIDELGYDAPVEALANRASELFDAGGRRLVERSPNRHSRSGDG